MFLSLPPLLLLGPVVGAVIVYLFLRMQVWSKPQAESVASHGLWVGIIGWMASSLQGAMNTGILTVNPTGPSAPTASGQIAGALAWPILACLTVHALGQLSYPAPKAPRRYAELTVRRIRDFLPRKLAWTTAAVFVFAALVIAWVAALPGHTPVLPTPPGQAPPSDNGYRGQGQEGRIPGWELAAWLGGALVVLAAGTLLVLVFIARRRQLETLNGDDNRALRSIATNRLLRTVATIAAGLASIAGNFAAQPAPGAMWQSSWFNYVGIVNMAVLLVMWWWRVPQLPSLVNAQKATSAGSIRADPQTHGAVRLTLSTGAALGVVGGLAGLAGWVSFMFVPGPVLRPIALPAAVAIVAALVLLAITCGELLLARNYGTANAPIHWPGQPVSRGLLSFAAGSGLVFAAVVTVTAIGQRLLLPAMPSWPGIIAMSLVVAFAGSLAVLAARRRHGITESDGHQGLDAALRAITMYRIVRMLAAYCLGQAAAVLLTSAEAWGTLFPAFDRIGPSPAIMAGAILAAVAGIVAITPVRSLFRTIPRVSAAKLGEPAQ
ncbi:hypothetical protein ACFRJ9_20925 [Paenarthrobacter sp. NPDC056912]|uniref:hypothetical protein n=1 Tax=Paenarthrobacter sp. NPDC056912 TaxID=3345965 RepID=UPI003670369B